MDPHRPGRHPVAGLALGVAAAAAAVLLRWLLDPHLTGVQFITFFPVVILVSYLVGTGAGLLTAGLCGVAGWYLFVSPVHSFRVETTASVITVIFYFATAGAIAVAVGAVRKAMMRERAAAAALRAEQDRARSVLASISDGFVLLDRDYRVLDINEEAMRLEQRPREEILGKTHWEAWPGTEESEIGRLYKRAMEGAQVSLEHCYTWPDGRYAWLEMRAYPTRDGLAIFYRDVTERKKSEQALKASETRARLALKAGRMGEWELDILNNSSYRAMRHDEIFGYDAPVAQWGVDTFLAHVVPEDRERVQRTFEEAAIGSGGWHFECRIRRANDGAIRWIQAHSEAQTGQDGRVERLVGLVGDITEQRLAQERQRLLLNELNHRVKNTLAVVQAIAQQTFKPEAASAPARRAFEGRLAALSAAQNVLTAETWESASLRQIVEDSIRPFPDEQGRIRVEGPDARLPPETSLSLALTLHELMTNAVKYGSLSVPAGAVDLAWFSDPVGIALVWREHGGPPVAPPERQGFGTRLIARSLAGEHEGRVRMDFRPEGLICTILLPVLEPEGG
jgi:PAS domain S-box-containing protein